MNINESSAVREVVEEVVGLLKTAGKDSGRLERARGLCKEAGLSLREIAENYNLLRQFSSAMTDEIVCWLRFMTPEGLRQASFSREEMLAEAQALALELGTPLRTIASLAMLERVLQPGE